MKNGVIPVVLLALALPSCAFEGPGMIGGRCLQRMKCHRPYICTQEHPANAPKCAIPVVETDAGGAAR